MSEPFPPEDNTKVRPGVWGIALAVAHLVVPALAMIAVWTMVHGDLLPIVAISFFLGVLVVAAGQIRGVRSCEYLLAGLSSVWLLSGLAMARWCVQWLYLRAAP